MIEPDNSNEKERRSVPQDRELVADMKEKAQEIEI